MVLSSQRGRDREDLKFSAALKGMVWFKLSKLQALPDLASTIGKSFWILEEKKNLINVGLFVLFCMNVILPCLLEKVKKILLEKCLTLHEWLFVNSGKLLTVVEDEVQLLKMCDW